MKESKFQNRKWKRKEEAYNEFVNSESLQDAQRFNQKIKLYFGQAVNFEREAEIFTSQNRSITSFFRRSFLFRFKSITNATTNFSTYGKGLLFAGNIRIFWRLINNRCTISNNWKSAFPLAITISRIVGWNTGRVTV